MNKKLIQKACYALFLVIFIGCENVEFKSSHLSLTLNESKLRKVFVALYKSDKQSLIGVDFNEAWIEKRWTNELQGGSDITKIVGSLQQLVINFKTKNLFSDKIYWDKILIKDEQGNILGSDKGVLFLELDSLKSTPMRLKLLVIKSSGKSQPNLDNTVIDSFILKKQ